jgi:hypothetical protein
VVEESHHVFRPFRFSWLAMGLTDEAAWYATLANAAAWRGGRPGSLDKGGMKTPEALKYYSLSLESISKRLRQAPGESDLEGLIVAVAGLICHDVGPLIKTVFAIQSRC